jgi:outer membrane receptor for ferrienterochelin and colicins
MKVTLRLPWSFAITIILIIADVTNSPAQQANGTLVVQVRSDSRPVERVEVTVGERVELTNQAGEAMFELPAGNTELKVERHGFKAKTAQASVTEGGLTRISIEVESESVANEQITVTATRTETRIEDEPLRVEVLNQEELRKRHS